MVDLGSVVRPGDALLWGQACAEPQTLVEAVVSQRASLGGVGCFLGSSYSGIVKPEHADRLKLSSYCGTGTNRALADAGALDILPVPYSQLGPLIRDGKIRCDVLLLQVSPPNARGEYSLGLAADYLVPALDVCRAIVAEVNDQVPWTHTERLLTKDDFDLVVETSRRPAAPTARPPSEVDLAIARNAVPFVPAGAVLEFGIGALPDALCALLGRHEGLRVHSGTVGDGVIELARRGVVSRVDCAMLIGSPALFAFARNNERVRLHSSEYTHERASAGPAGALRRDEFRGGSRPDRSGERRGGRNQLSRRRRRCARFRACGKSLNRRVASIVLLPARRIVESVAGPVSVPRSEAGVIVSERGAADLRGCSLKERQRRLQAIATA